MAIKLYYLAPSYPCRVVAMTLKALNLEYETQIVNLMKGEQRNPEYLALNPRGKIPCLQDGEFIISESRAISAYLCNQYQKGDDSTSLYPVDPKTRGVVDQMLYVSENTSDAVIMGYLNIPGVIFRNEKPKTDQDAEIHKTLKLYEDFLSKNEYIAGNHLTIADFYMQAPLMMLEFSKFDDFKEYPKTLAWKNKIKKLPYFAECNKEGLDQLRDLYSKGLEKQQQD